VDGDPLGGYLILILGVICASLGGELFTPGAVGVARWMRISPAVIAVTVAAFATSSPELAVGVRTARAGAPRSLWVIR
jgi:cation:H+ antiporter